MNIEKRGSEKLLQMENDLCPLTDEELNQVAGGGLQLASYKLGDYFPIGILPPDLLELDKYNGHGKLNGKINIPNVNSISNGF